MWITDITEMPWLMTDACNGFLCSTISFNQTEKRCGFTENLTDSGIWEIRTDEINVIRIDPNIQSKAGFMFTVTRQGNITICKVFTIFL